MLGVVAVEHGLGEELVGRAAASSAVRRARCRRRSSDRASAPKHGQQRRRARRASTSRRSVMPTSCRRPGAGRGPRAAARRRHASASTPSTVSVSNQVSLTQRETGRAQARRRRSRSAGAPARRCGASPPGRARRRRSPAMLASSTWAVQMFDVAFSRRMCCSRVCSARRSAGRPAVSVLTPTSRPGRARARRLVGGDERRVRAAEAHRHAEALRRPDGDVGAELARRRQSARRPAGRWRRRRAPPAAWTRSMAARQSTTAPVDVGQAEQRAEAAVGDARRRRRRRARCRSARRGSRSTAIVCGWVSWWTKNAVGCRAFASRRAHRHRLGRGGRLVEQRRVGDGRGR